MFECRFHEETVSERIFLPGFVLALGCLSGAVGAGLGSWKGARTGQCREAHPFVQPGRAGKRSGAVLGRQIGPALRAAPTAYTHKNTKVSMGPCVRMCACIYIKRLV